MGLQLIFAVETDKKCNSDWIYIKDTIGRFYTYNHHIKLSVVYMNGKTNYERKEKDVKALIKQYVSSAKNNKSVVIYCTDCDNYDKVQADVKFLDNIKKFCKERRYEHVWFCKDIENVYLGKKVQDNQKGKEAANFKAKEMINKVNEKSLSELNYKLNSSNILKILDRFTDENFQKKIVL